MRLAHLLISAFMLALGLFFHSADAEDKAKTVSLELKNVPMGRALNALAEQSGHTFIVSPDVIAPAGPGISLEAVSDDQAIAILMIAYRVCIKPIDRSSRVYSVLPCGPASEA